MTKIFTKDEKRLLKVDNKTRIKEYYFFEEGANAYLNGYDYSKLKEAINEKNVLITDKDILDSLGCGDIYLKKRSPIIYFTITGFIIKRLGLDIKEGKQEQPITGLTPSGLYEKEDIKIKEIAGILGVTKRTLQSIRKKYGVLFDNGFKLYRRGINLEFLQSKLIKQRALPSKQEIIDILGKSIYHDFKKGTMTNKKIDYVLILGVYLKLLNENVGDFLKKYEKLNKYKLEDKIKLNPKYFYY